MLNDLIRPQYACQKRLQQHETTLKPLENKKTSFKRTDYSYAAFENRSPGTVCEDRFRETPASFDEVERSRGLGLWKSLSDLKSHQIARFR